MVVYYHFPNVAGVSLQTNLLMALLTLLVMTSVLALGALLFTQGLICTCTSDAVNLTVEYK